MTGDDRRLILDHCQRSEESRIVITHGTDSMEQTAAVLGNEISADGRIRVNRNIMGLWLLQETRRAFAAAGRTYTYQDLADLRLEVVPDRPDNQAGFLINQERPTLLF